MKNLVLEDDEVFISFNYHPGIVAAVKKIPSRVYIPERRAWRIVLDEKSGLQFVRFCRENDFSIPGDIAEIALPFAVDDEIKELERVNHIKANIAASNAQDADVAIPATLRGTFRPFQKAGIAYMVENERVMNGDEMGLGKTLEAIGAVEVAGAYPCIVTCPASVKYNWELQIKQWLPSRSVSVIDPGRKMMDFDSDIVIVAYNTLTRKEILDYLLTVRWGGLVCDEFHYLKNKKSQRTSAVMKLRKKIQYRFLLSGTSVVNRPSELIAPLEILDRLDKDFGGMWRFARTYCGAYRTNFGIDMSGATNIEELHAKLRSTCYIRRNKKDVAKELPDKSRTVIPVDLDVKTARAYKQAEADIVKYLQGIALADAEFLESIKDLSEEEQRHAKDMREYDAGYKAQQAEHLVRIGKLKRIAAEGKIASAIEWIEDFLATGEKLLVFAHHAHIIEALATHFKAPTITGKVLPHIRQEIVEDFAQNANTKLLILNTKAGGTGIDGLQGVASNVFFLELGWTPAEHDQAEDRLYRIGQLYAVMCHYMLARNTIDGDIHDLINEKRAVTDAINAGIFTESEGSIVGELIDRMLARAG